MFPLAVVMMWFGYACAYTAIANIRNGYQGPRLSESLGFKIMLAPPTVNAWGRRAGGSS